jgi:hypothetical protein
MKTPGEKRMNNRWITAESKKGVIVRSWTGDVLVKCIRSVIPKRIYNNLQSSTEILRNNLKGHIDLERNIREVYHFGCTRDCSKEIRITKHSNKIAGKIWENENKPLWKLLNIIFKMEQPEMYDAFNNVELPKRTFGAWAGCALNADIPEEGVSTHNDPQDCRSGYCWVIPFGDFQSGGELVFPELKVTIPLFAGDLVYFKSYELQHGIRKFKGKRKSVIMYMHNNILFPCAKKE